MPELPEVQTVCSDLEFLQGQRLQELVFNDQRVNFESEIDPDVFFGQILQRIHRRGKYIIWEFKRGQIIQHLRMTGKMLHPDSEIIQAQKAGSKQIRAHFCFEESNFIFFDTRRFGTLTLVEDQEQFWLKKKMAPDSYAKESRDQARKLFIKKTQATKKNLKASLLDQSMIAGVGNIYADEALHLSKIHPETQANSISEKQARNLFTNVIKVFHAAISKRGTSSSDYLDTNGEPGLFKKYLNVYRCTGEPCKTCQKAEIEKIKLAGRSTHFCPYCQR